MGLFNRKPTDEPLPAEEEEKKADDPYKERFEKLETDIASIGQAMSTMVEWLQQAKEEPEPEKPTNTDTYSPFLDELAARGSDAVLADPAINSMLDVRMGAMLDWERARSELATQYPEAYDPASEVFKTKSQVREWYERVGVQPSVLNTRRMEEAMTREAIGAHVDKVAEGRRARKPPGFVEGGGPGGEHGGSAASVREAEIAAVFGVSVEDYNKLRKQLEEQEVIGGGHR